MSSKDAPNTARLSPADAADLADRVVEHAESWLTRDDRIAPIIVLGGPPDLEQETLRCDDEQRREQAQADLIRDGRLLAAALVAHGLDSAPLLTLLNHTNPGHCIRGANEAEAVWPQIKVALQVAVIRLRKINTDASPSTLTPENGAATAEQTEVADVAAGARPSSVPRQVSRARSHSDTVPMDQLKPSQAKTVAGDDAPNKNGYVLCPNDPAAYVALNDVLNEHTPKEWPLNMKQLVNILEDYKTNQVRWTRPADKKGKPIRNRRNVHLGDWHACCKRASHTDSEGFPMITEAQIKAGKAEINRGKGGRK